MLPKKGTGALSLAFVVILMLKLSICNVKKKGTFVKVNQQANILFPKISSMLLSFQLHSPSKVISSAANKATQINNAVTHLGFSLTKMVSNLQQPQIIKLEIDLKRHSDG